MTERSIVVTGAGGWLGRALVSRLLMENDGAPLRLLVHTTAEAETIRWAVEGRAGVEVVIGDISRADTARRLLRDADGSTEVVHAAGIIHPRRTREFIEVNAHGTRHLAEAALDRGVRRVVHISSNSPFGTNPDPADTFRTHEPFHPYLGYGRSKMQAELSIVEAHERGLDTVIIRPPWFYGPFQPARQTSFFRLVRRGRFPVVGDGGQRRSMVYVGNLVDGVLAALASPNANGRAYWIADAQPHTVADIVATVGRALAAEGFEVAPNRVRVPVAVSRLAETADRMVQAAGRYQQQLHVLGEMGHTIACDISAATDEIGYHPAVELYEGMRASIRWCIEQGIEL